MTERLTVTVERDHLESLTRTRAIRGVAELVWNGLDAEAQSVRVKVVQDELERVESVEVADDGHGMTYDEAVAAFGHLGGSWKLNVKHSRNNHRLLHGHHGQGRWRGFSIGSFIEWISVAEDPERGRMRTKVTGRQSDLREFVVDDPVSTDEPLGTTVVITNVDPEAASQLLRDDAVDWLTKQFALYLERYRDVSIVFRGGRVDPSVLQTNRETYDVQVPALDEAVALVVIEWSKDFGRELVLCDENGVALWSTQTRVRAPGFNFTAYINWAGFRRQEEQLSLVDGPLNPFAGVIEAAQEELREHFVRRGAEMRESVIEKWKSEQVYPFEGEPTTDLERVEREIFDTVASTASAAVDTAGDRVGKRFSLRLLKEAIEQSPTTLRRVLQEVLDLSDTKLAELDSVLQRTTLSALVSLGKKVSDRLEFIEGLHLLLFEPETRTKLLERQQLHELLAAEPWIFGEEWALALSERQLTSVLREHLRLLGRDDFVGKLEAVELADGTTQARADLMFSLSAPVETQHRRHLVVELKRPSVKLGLEQYTQIVEYADAVVSDPRFDTIEVAWVFWLVGNEIDRPLRGQVSQLGLEPGLGSRGADGRYEIWVKTWAQLLDTSRHRLKFVRKELDYQSTDESALETLRRAHDRLLPGAARSSQ